MNGDVNAVVEDTSAETAARALVERLVAGAPVVTGDGRPVGVVTLGDLLDARPAAPAGEAYPLFYRVTDDRLHELDRSATVIRGEVGDAMSPFVLSIESTATMAEAASRMVSEGVHRLLVRSGGRLVGVVTSIDLLRGFVLQTRR